MKNGLRILKKKFEVDIFFEETMEDYLTKSLVKFMEESLKESSQTF